MLGWDHLLLEDQDASSHFDQDNLHKAGASGCNKDAAMVFGFSLCLCKESFTQPVKALAVFAHSCTIYLDIIVHSAIINSAKTYKKKEDNYERILALVLTLAMVFTLALGFTGCGKEEHHRHPAEHLLPLSPVTAAASPRTPALLLRQCPMILT